ncbi:hypothetical protein TNCV_3681391 [Trichonephila clavipes]|uniref:Uncharacterized protein n=1 Tax=Trichonephila clavipes TaxID=2585209 RepID=A0A8X6RAR4_TRICX|nr:hypothetical protein TNCV_3681391 [Trichonephila clavipes]
MDYSKSGADDLSRVRVNYYFFKMLRSTQCHRCGEHRKRTHGSRVVTVTNSLLSRARVQALVLLKTQRVEGLKHVKSVVVQSPLVGVDRKCQSSSPLDQGSKL